VPEGQDFTVNLNPNSLVVKTGCKVEPLLKNARPGARFQFLRSGYFVVDCDASKDKQIFNRTVTLRDTWAKIQKQNK
jgi:glutaminyl-tRNA synthetase